MGAVLFMGAVSSVNQFLTVVNLSQLLPVNM